MNSLDNATRNDFLLISKSLIPYLNPNNQRSAAIFIKAIELLYTVEVFSKEDFVRGFSRSTEQGWEKSFLRDIRKDLSDERGYFIDVLLKLSEAKDIFAMRNQSHSPMSSSTNLDSGIPVQESITPEEPKMQTNANTTHQGPNPSDILSSLSSLLDPNQLQLLKVLSGFMK
ncbi:hypothetical protein CS063_07780 [Sporanaerobium hydrogeniformans]|uniref:Uncharacterized protein n=1 Tax=Sporanaerobium hydrogeniformans TaxID=3072179 RepID=A0AC61DE48_9FIRM|nr:hypothetical protein [Sporanaerobium hydrogeniformans]PHV70912.1 hypothetical protein CS063_07780 [Sporanaerobium hydrogeniformans]